MESSRNGSLSSRDDSPFTKTNNRVKFLSLRYYSRRLSKSKLEFYSPLQRKSYKILSVQRHLRQKSIHLYYPITILVLLKRYQRKKLLILCKEKESWCV